MKRSKAYAMSFVLLLLIAPVLVFAAKVGEPAPDFTGTTSSGKTVKLSEFRGKWVVLEWHNNGCPYVKKFYNAGKMQELQRDWIARGVVWLTIISSAPGKQGYVTAEQENEYLAQMKATPTFAILDPTGVIGRLYDAKTTPQMVVIDPKGLMVYDGAIDDRPTSNPNDIASATNYLNLALEQAMAGKPVTTPVTKPYGCSVKYPD